MLAASIFSLLALIDYLAGTERRIHFWLGDESSVDEKGGAALWATHLDDWFGGDPVQYRETQNSESEKFMGLFPNGVTYKKGGVAGAFRNVKVNENENQALYQVKGKRSAIIYHEYTNLRSGQVDSARIRALKSFSFRLCQSTPTEGILKRFST